MTKFIIPILILSFLLAPAGFVKAQTQAELIQSLQGQINILLQMINTLQLQIVALAGKQVINSPERIAEEARIKARAELEEKEKFEQEKAEQAAREAKEAERERLIAEWGKFWVSSGRDVYMLSTEELRVLVEGKRKAELESKKRRCEEVSYPTYPHNIPLRHSWWDNNINECVKITSQQCNELTKQGFMNLRWYYYELGGGWDGCRGTNIPQLPPLSPAPLSPALEDSAPFLRPARCC